ncbi:MAG: substrate-binding domain-containing protein [Spirochaetes bacterium]|nr:substrate-binding domain-containing protein [Spirochaetota bacterium]
MENKKSDGTPQYIRVREALRADITHGRYPIGGLIPREEDIAAMYQVSRVTVRKALDDLKREKLITSKKRFGTVVTGSAGKTRQRRKNIIGVITPNMYQTMYAGILHTLESTLHKSGIDLIVHNINLSPETERAGINALLKRGVDGIVHIWDKKSEANIERVRHVAGQMPLIIVDHFDKSIPADFIMPDNSGSTRDAVSHLIDEGCRHIMHIRATTGLWSADERTREFLAVTEKHGIDAAHAPVIVGNYDAATALRALTLYMKKGGTVPDGIFASCDMTAYAAYEFFSKLNIRVPDELKIVGFGNDIGMRPEHNMLSTVEHHPDAIGEAVAERVLERIYGGKNELTVRTIPGTLIVRSSSRKT